VVSTKATRSIFITLYLHPHRPGGSLASPETAEMVP
jgi:hypothetical protein